MVTHVCIFIATPACRTGRDYTNCADFRKDKISIISIVIFYLRHLRNLSKRYRDSNCNRFSDRALVGHAYKVLPPFRLSEPALRNRRVQSAASKQRNQVSSIFRSYILHKIPEVEWFTSRHYAQLLRSICLPVLVNLLAQPI